MSRMTPEQSREVVRLYHEGIPYAEIGQRIGFNPDLIPYHLRKNGFAPDRGRGQKQHTSVPDIIELAHTGLNNGAIAQKLGRSKVYVRRVISLHRSAGNVIKYDCQRRSV